MITQNSTDWEKHCFWRECKNKSRLIISRSSGYLVKYTKEVERRLEENKCPVCGLPKEKWTRRKDWMCCSTDCTSNFHNNGFYEIFSQVSLRNKVFARDNYTCVKCGKKAFEDYKKLPKWEEQSDSSKTFSGSLYSPYNWIDDKGKPFILDHIIPIALGGEEYDIKNTQTLCPTCNKEKTKQDAKRIAEIRRIEAAFEGMNYSLVKGLIGKARTQKSIEEYFGE
jgi:5-methylcytosine-specific restriction endonuclease McrA